jgi:hypothetical protein
MPFASLRDDVGDLMAPGTNDTAPMGYGELLSAHSKRLASDKRAFGMEHTPPSAHAYCHKHKHKLKRITPH